MQLLAVGHVPGESLLVADRDALGRELESSKVDAPRSIP